MPTTRLRKQTSRKRVHKSMAIVVDSSDEEWPEDGQENEGNDDDDRVDE